MLRIFPQISLLVNFSYEWKEVGLFYVWLVLPGVVLYCAIVLYCLVTIAGQLFFSCSFIFGQPFMLIGAQ